MGLAAQLADVHFAHHAADTDVHLRNVAFADRMDGLFSIGQVLVEARHVFHVAAQAILRFGYDDVELSGTSISHKGLNAGAHHVRAAHSMVGICLDDLPTL
nr:hypothetical protein [Falsochrobactrum ovis]